MLKRLGLPLLAGMLLVTTACESGTGDDGTTSPADGEPFIIGAATAQTATPGNLWFSITVRGKAVHALVRRELVREDGGGSRVGVNALEKAVFAIMPALQQLEQEWGITKSNIPFGDLVSSLFIPV